MTHPNDQQLKMIPLQLIYDLMQNDHESLNYLEPIKNKSASVTLTLDTLTASWFCNLAGDWSRHVWKPLSFEEFELRATTLGYTVTDVFMRAHPHRMMMHPLIDTIEQYNNCGTYPLLKAYKTLRHLTETDEKKIERLEAEIVRLNAQLVDHD